MKHNFSKSNEMNSRNIMTFISRSLQKICRSGKASAPKWLPNNCATVRKHGKRHLIKRIKIMPSAGHLHIQSNLVAPSRLTKVPPILEKHECAGICHLEIQIPFTYLIIIFLICLVILRCF